MKRMKGEKKSIIIIDHDKLSQQYVAEDELLCVKQKARHVSALPVIGTLDSCHQDAKLTQKKTKSDAKLRSAEDVEKTAIKSQILSAY